MSKTDTEEGKHVRPRIGKTNRDRAGGAQERAAHNRAARVAWQDEAARNERALFPSECSNGRRNRSRAAAKGGTAKATLYTNVEDKRFKPEDVRRRSFNRA